jgi:hypothetical protein
MSSNRRGNRSVIVEGGKGVHGLKRHLR